MLSNFSLPFAKFGGFFYEPKSNNSKIASQEASKTHPFSYFNRRCEDRWREDGRKLF